ncbi:hypothetical protein LAZ67_X002611 [Cordylochernes scorpioides]|uniref:ATP-dependent DNA helicase n=1 Tax=Cordylochernes scorpioides TaxID=51811 RepID=A0ABY6LTR9_9ARAC|nr:hypothetical protein LAZ67_X002611 [Cordylochernes scorpioides]
MNWYGQDLCLQHPNTFFRAFGKIITPLASTGIAATLLSGRQTVHSTFKLLIPLLENSAPKAQYRAFGIVDRILRDMVHCDLAFCGKDVNLGGDFLAKCPWQMVGPASPTGRTGSACSGCRTSNSGPEMSNSGVPCLAAQATLSAIRAMFQEEKMSLTLGHKAVQMETQTAHENAAEDPVVGR